MSWNIEHSVTHMDVWKAKSDSSLGMLPQLMLQLMLHFAKSDNLVVIIGQLSSNSKSGSCKASSGSGEICKSSAVCTHRAYCFAPFW